MIQNQPNSSEISSLRDEVEYWKRMYNEKTFDFSGATVTVDDLPYGISAWDATGALITGEVPSGMYGSRKIAGTLTKGSVVQFDGLDWIVADISGNIYTLMLKKMTETTQFGSNTTYSGSTLASKCTTFQNNMSSNALSVVNSKTVQSVTAKVWIATRDMISNWTDSTDGTSNAWYGIRRWTRNDGTYDGVDTYQYWCSNSAGSNNVWGINNDGWFNIGSADDTTGGFRPCIEVVQ